MKNLIIISFLFLISPSNNTLKTIQQTKKEKIIVYGSDSCHSCLDTKAFLREKQIQFTYYDIDINKEKEQEMLVKLKKNNIPIHSLSLPVVDNKGDVFLNQGNLKEFFKVLSKKIKKNEH